MPSFLISVCVCVMQVVDFFNGNLKRRRQKRKEAKAMMKLKRLSTIHTEVNGAVIGNKQRPPQNFSSSHMLFSSLTVNASSFSVLAFASRVCFRVGGIQGQSFVTKPQFTNFLLSVSLGRNSPKFLHNVKSYWQVLESSWNQRRSMKPADLMS